MPSYKIFFQLEKCFIRVKSKNTYERFLDMKNNFRRLLSKSFTVRIFFQVCNKILSSIFSLPVFYGTSQQNLQNLIFCRTFHITTIYITQIMQITYWKYKYFFFTVYNNFIIIRNIFQANYIAIQNQIFLYCRMLHIL